MDAGISRQTRVSQDAGGQLQRDAVGRTRLRPWTCYPKHKLLVGVQNRTNAKYELLVCKDGAASREDYRLKPGIYGRVLSYRVMAGQWPLLSLERYLATRHQHAIEHRGNAYAVPHP